MMPIGPLMIEHRLIERMIKTAEKNLKKFKNNQDHDTEFIRISLKVWKEETYENYMKNIDKKT